MTIETNTKLVEIRQEKATCSGNGIVYKVSYGKMQIKHNFLANPITGTVDPNPDAKWEDVGGISDEN